MQYTHTHSRDEGAHTCGHARRFIAYVFYGSFYSLIDDRRKRKKLFLADRFFFHSLFLAGRRSSLLFCLLLVRFVRFEHFLCCPRCMPCSSLGTLFHLPSTMTPNEEHHGIGALSVSKIFNHECQITAYLAIQLCNVRVISSLFSVVFFNDLVPFDVSRESCAQRISERTNRTYYMPCERLHVITQRRNVLFNFYGNV